MSERKVGLLTLNKLRRVAFVQRGANQLANISLVKSADVDPENAPSERKEVPVTQSQVMQKIEKAADELRSSDTSLTREQSISKVMDSQPDLVDEYRSAEPDFPEAVEKSQPPVVGGDVAAKLAARIEALADKLARERNVTKSAAYDLVDRDPEGSRLRSEYAKATGDDDGAEAFAKQAEFIGG